MCGDEVTYVVTRNIKYTNVCYFRCGFCAFSKGKLAENLRGPAYLVPEEEIVRRVREAWERGAIEVCLQGGIHPSFTGDYYAGRRARRSRRAVPDIHVHAFSALEVWQGAATLGLDLDEYLDRLRELGLGSLPGTAAEILDDEVRAVICPDKVSTDAVARGARRRAPGRPALERDDHVRSRRATRRTGRGTCSSARAAERARAASPSSCRCRSCTWRRRSTSGSRASRADVRRGAARSTRSPGSRSTR